MKKTQVAWDFIKYPVTEKVAFYNNIIVKLTDNPTFPWPPVSLVDTKTAVNKLEAAIIEARDGGHSAVSIMHDNEKLTDNLFRILANYVESVANGDETTILISGFHGTKQPTPIQKATLAAANGPHSGSVKLTSKAFFHGGGLILFRWLKVSYPPQKVNGYR